MKLHASKRQDAVIPTASMADIALLLIIFFLVTFQIEVDKTQVTLPATGIRLEVPEKSAYISITEDGMVRVSTGEEISQIVPMADVATFASSTVARDPERAFVLKADKETPYRLVDQVVDALKLSQAKTIYLLSEQEVVVGGAADGGV